MDHILIKQPLRSAVRAGALAGAFAFPLAVAGCGPALVAGAILLFSSSGGSKGCSIPGTPVGVTVTGKVEYQKRGFDGAGRAVTTLEPVRGARVQVLRLNCGVQVVATADTDADGDYQATVNTPSGSILRVAVLSERLDPASPAVVRNNSRERLIYSFEGGNLPLGVQASQTMDAGLVVPIDCVDQPAAAFNLLEMTRRGYAAIAGSVQAPGRPLNVLWDLGDPSGSFFSPTSTVDLDGDGRAGDPFIQIRGGDRTNRNGRTNSDPFDDGLVIHEFGHFVAFLHSRDDSPGGPHAVGELLDPRLAWSEGWADFFATMARNDPVLLDTDEDLSNCSWPVNTFILDISNKQNLCQSASCCLGIGSEEAVGSFLWSVFHGLGVPPATILATMASLKTHHFVYVGDFIAEIEAMLPAQQAAIAGLASDEGMTEPDGSLTPFPSAFPDLQPSSGSLQATVSGDIDGCSFNFCRVFPVSFIGSHDFFELLLPAGRSRLTGALVTTATDPACGSDLELRIFNQPQTLLFTTEGQATKTIQFPFDANFPPGSFILIEVAGDSGNGQKGSYTLTLTAQ